MALFDRSRCIVEPRVAGLFGEMYRRRGESRLFFLFVCVLFFLFPVSLSKMSTSCCEDEVTVKPAALDQIKSNRVKDLKKKKKN